MMKKCNKIRKKILLNYFGSVTIGTLLAITIAGCGKTTVTGDISQIDKHEDDIETPTNPPEIVQNRLINGRVGKNYSVKLEASDGTPPYTWELESGILPDGLTLIPATGEISGTPEKETIGSIKFFVKVIDSKRDDDIKEFSMDISPPKIIGDFIWKELSANGNNPSGRVGHSSIYDPVNNQMITALGSDGGGGALYKDTFSLSLKKGSESWSPLTSIDTGNGRWGSGVIFDSKRNRMVIFAGSAGGEGASPISANDTWELDLAPGNETWSELSTPGLTPPGRVATCSIYDTTNDRMIIFGGGTGMSAVPQHNDLWSLNFNGNQWSELDAGTAPSARVGMVCVYDSANKRMIVFGGRALFGAQGDLWSLNLTPGSETWTKLSPGGQAPAARQYSVGVYEPIRNVMIIHGGENGPNNFTDLWEVTMIPGKEEWKTLTPQGTPPSIRDSHSAALDSKNNRIIIFGGFTKFPSTPKTDLWELSFR